MATNETDGYKRMIRSTVVNGFKDKVKVFGIGEVWKGGDVQRFAGGGHKINILKKNLSPYKKDENRIILFTDR